MTSAARPSQRQRNILVSTSSDVYVAVGASTTKSCESTGYREHSAARPPCAVLGGGSGALKFKGTLTNLCCNVVRSSVSYYVKFDRILRAPI